MSEAGTSVSGSSYASSGSSLADRNLSAASDGRGEKEVGTEVIGQDQLLEKWTFAPLYTLSRNRRGTDIRWTIGRIVLEALQMFLVVFNTALAWNIGTDIWIWKAVSWTLLRLVIVPMGYSSYIKLFYTIAAAGGVTVAGSMYAAAVYKEGESNSAWLKRLVSALQLLSLVIFSVFWACCLDALGFIFNCNWKNFSEPGGPPHTAFPAQSCLDTQHIIHMVVGAIAICMFSVVTVWMSVSECDLNPLTRNHLASPVAVASMYISLLKVGLVLVGAVLSVLGGQVQSVLMLILVVYIVYWMLTLFPYYYDLVNFAWVGIWFGILFTTVLLVVTNFTMDLPDAAAVESHRSQMTWGLLYGIFPSMLLGAWVSYMYLKHRRKPLPKLIEAAAMVEDSIVLKDVYRFKDIYEAEFLLRVMRKWDIDGIPDPAAISLGQFMFKCAMARLPNQPTLLCLYSNFLMISRNDSHAARTQLQLAGKNTPSVVERYLIYVTQRTIKRLKADTDGVDLIGYVEFQRAYRACVRAHQLALHAQRQFWLGLLQSKVSFKELQQCILHMDKMEKQATIIYKSVLERYPANGKLLKIYGRFLEFVKNDPWNARKFYAESSKLGSDESLLDLAATSAETDIRAKLTSLLGDVDEKTDALVIIDAFGSILMINASCSKLFGYTKGELDGKNVSVLMPQPYSGRHMSYMHRYISTGKPKSIGCLRQLVALRKDRSIFPITLLVQKLSGIAADSIFLGIVRPTFSRDPSVVKVWVNPAGIVLCADDHYRDWFGVESKDLAGKHFSSLTTEPDAITKFLAGCAAVSPQVLAANPPSTQVKLLHKYLPPVQAHVDLEVGGTDEHAILQLILTCSSDTLALMVTDTRGRIQFASGPMAAMVGYPVKTLTDGMTLGGLMPPPYAQLHAQFMKDFSHEPPPSSCRAGGVVQLLHSDGNKVPVTLQLSQHDEHDKMQHVIKVFPATASQLLDQQRIALQLNHKGVVLSINANASKAVFGFDPSDLVGRPLGSFCNLFHDWKERFGSDESLLILLGMRAQRNMDVIYRAGVHSPLTDIELNSTKAAAEGQGMSLLNALRAQHREQPAILDLKMSETAQDAILALGSGSGKAAGIDAETTPVLTLTLWRAEGLASVVEVDHKLGVVSAESATGLMFGIPATALLRKNLKSLLSLPSTATAADLLDKSGKKSQLKQGAAWRIGPVKNLDANHTDLGALKMQIQAISKDGKSTDRLLILVRVLNSSNGSLEPLLALRSADLSADGARKTNQQQDDSDQDFEGSDRDGGGSDDHDDDRDLDDVNDGGEQEADKYNDKTGRSAIKHWLTNSLNGRGQPYPNEGDESLDQEAGGPARRGRAKARLSGSDAGEGSAADGGSSATKEDVQQLAVTETVGRALSVASGSQSAGGSELADGVSVTSGDEAEFTVDWRRAKRIKKLRHMMTSTTAQVASQKFRKHIGLVVLVFLVVQIAYCAIMLQEITRRYKISHEVGEMADAIEHTQMLASRASMIQKCGHEHNAAMSVCDPALVKRYSTRLRMNYDTFKMIHQSLYLGYDELRPFPDKRLTDYWSYRMLPEYNWFALKDGQEHVLETRNNTLWNMGNMYLQYSTYVQFNAAALKSKLINTTYWQYIYHNGLNSIYNGYRWSLDVYVDYAWNQVRSLRNMLVILLIIEVVVVQWTAIAYKLFLLRKVNVENMKRFSVFLALPSATIRGLASKQTQVDDDDEKEIDDDELDAVNQAAAAGAATMAEDADAEEKKSKAESKGKGKSVRVRISASDDDDEDDDQDVRRKKSSNRKKALAAANEHAAANKDTKMDPNSVVGKIKTFITNIWGPSSFKVNGKKLIPHSDNIWKLLVPLLLWVAVVIIIFSVCTSRVQDLEGPLANLNTAARVRALVARVRYTSVVYGFEEDPVKKAQYRDRLSSEVKTLKREYDTLLYGGHLGVVAEGISFDTVNPPAAFTYKDVSNIFFKTTDCLRFDKSGCFKEDSKYYSITRQGLDAMVYRFIDEMMVFVNLPDQLAYPNHTSYDYVTSVVANDVYDGLKAAATLLVNVVASKLADIRQLQLLLSFGSMAFLVLYAWKLLKPFMTELNVESKAVAGLMSQLPAEVDVEGLVRLHVLGQKNEPNNNSLRAPSMAANPAAMQLGQGMQMGPGMQMGMQYGGGGYGMMPPQNGYAGPGGAYGGAGMNGYGNRR